MSFQWEKCFANLMNYENLDIKDIFVVQGISVEDVIFNARTLIIYQVI